MSHGRAVAGGAAVLVGAQALVTLVQIGTGAATARLLQPSAFGAFAAAMAITGILGVLLTSATTTAVLREPDLTGAQVWKLWWTALLQGLLGATVTLLAAPAWAALYHSPEAEPMVRWLAIQVGVVPLAITSAALLRRERRAVADAATQAGSVIVGLLVGVSVVWAWRSQNLLVVSPIVTAVTMLLSTAALRRRRFSLTRPDRAWSVRRANTQIVLQNVYFFVLAAVPVWLVSRVGNAHELGLYSRASAIPTMVVGAATVGLVRSVQPYYRSVAPEAHGAALRDLVVMTGAVGIPVMAVVAACAHPLIEVWLGPNWLGGAPYVPLVAAGAAAYLMFTILANAAETLSFLREVRFAQLAMLPALLVVIALAFANGSAMVASATTLVVALPGLAALIWVLERRGMGGPGAAGPATGDPDRDRHRHRAGRLGCGPRHRAARCVVVADPGGHGGDASLRGHLAAPSRVASDAGPRPGGSSDAGHRPGGAAVRPAWVTAAGTGRRGAGFGNEVMAWGKAHGTAEALGLHHLPPCWALNRFHLAEQLGLSRAPMLGSEAAVRLLPSTVLTQEIYRGIGVVDFGDAMVAARDAGLLRGRVLVTEGMWGGYAAIARSRGFLHERLLDAPGARDLVAATAAGRGLRVGLHVRRGDFEGGSPEPGTFNRPVATSWFVAVLRSLTAQLGDRASYVVCSDAPEEVLVDLAAVPQTRVLRGTGRSAPLQELAVLASCDLLVCSVSSFSMLAAFLSDRPYLWYAPHLTRVDGCATIWGHEAAQQRAGSSTRQAVALRGDEPARGVPVPETGEVPVDVLGLETPVGGWDRRRDLLYYGAVPTHTETGSRGDR